MLGYDIARIDSRTVDPKTEHLAFLFKFKKWMSEFNISTVIDIGAHTGEFASVIHEILPDVTIVSFEPLSESHQVLMQRMKKATNFNAFNCALGNVNSKVIIYKSDYTPSSSLLRMASLHKEAFPFTRGGSLEEVEVRRLDDVIKNVKLRNDLLVKIDVQGYEREVIFGGDAVISQARIVIVEVSFKPLYESQPLFDDIYRIMRERHFSYAGSLDQLLSPIDGSILQADALFIRDSGDIIS